MKVGQKYPSKILLFGEYSLLMGSEALGIPFRHLGAGLSLPSGRDQPGSAAEAGNSLLEKYYEDWLCLQDELRAVLDLDSLLKDIHRGLFVESDIPVKSGIGSSGAFCAAIYGTYARDPLFPVPRPDQGTLRSLRSAFILMESWFHGRSSGFDPLLSYTGRPLRMQGSGAIEPITLDGEFSGGLHVFLADAGPKEETAELIRRTMKQFIHGNSGTGPAGDLARLNNHCISSLLAGDKPAFTEAVKNLSGFQLSNMPWLVPGKISKLWARGLEDDSFYIKLCGSGGGGFMLGLTGNPARAAEIFRSEGLDIIKVELND